MRLSSLGLSESEAQASSLLKFACALHAAHAFGRQGPVEVLRTHPNSKAAYFREHSLFCCLTLFPGHPERDELNGMPGASLQQ